MKNRIPLGNKKVVLPKDINFLVSFYNCKKKSPRFSSTVFFWTDQGGRHLSTYTPTSIECYFVFRHSGEKDSLPCIGPVMAQSLK